MAELMDARRAVGVATRRSDDAGERAARRRVQDAKVALGERGERWWEEPSDDGVHDRLAAAVLALSGHRGPERTICPSDAARAVGGEGWRRLMDPVRAVVRELAEAGEVELSQKGEPIDPEAGWKGPIRIRRL